MYEFVLQRKYNAEKRASDVKKVKNRRKQNFEGEANNMQLDKEDTRRSNLNGKCVFNILILLFVFIMFNKLICKVRFHIIIKFPYSAHSDWLKQCALFNNWFML